MSDVVVRGEMPLDVRRSVDLWAGLVAGALEESEYRSKLASASFENVEIEPTRVYNVEDARQFLAGEGVDAECCCCRGGGKIHERLYPSKKAGGVLLRSKLLR